MPDSICKYSYAKSSDDTAFVSSARRSYSVDIVVFSVSQTALDNYPPPSAADPRLFDGSLTHTCSRYIVTDGI